VCRVYFYRSKWGWVLQFATGKQPFCRQRGRAAKERLGQLFTREKKLTTYILELRDNKTRREGKRGGGKRWVGHVGGGEVKGGGKIGRFAFWVVWGVCWWGTRIVPSTGVCWGQPGPKLKGYRGWTDGCVFLQWWGGWGETKLFDGAAL